MNSVLLLILFVCFLWFLRIRIQCQYTLFSYVVSYNISTLCCKVVLVWPRPNATNDEANKWGDLVYGVPEAFKKHQQTKTLVSTHKSVVKQQSSKLGLCMLYLLDIFYAHKFWHILFLILRKLYYINYHMTLIWSCPHECMLFCMQSAQHRPELKFQ